MSPRLLITRPEPAAGRFAADLRAEMPGVEILVAPLMRITYGGTLPPPAPGEALVLTSRHGVEGFCRLSARRDLRAYAVGEATAEAARRRGFATIAAGGDAASLIARIAAAGEAGPLLHPRGAHVAADVAGALRGAGLVAREAVVYDQEAQPLSAEARAVLGGTAPVIVPLMSPRSGRLFFDAAGRCRAPLFIAAISPNAAQGVPEGAACHVLVADAPDAGAMRAALHNLLTAAKRLEGAGGAQ